MLLHELLYSMLGYTGKIIVKRDGEFALANGLPLIDSSERALIQKLLVTGQCYSEVERFCTEVLLGDDEANDTVQGAFLTAFALGLETCLEPYRSRVLELEQRLLRSIDLSLPALQQGFGEFELMLSALRQLVLTVKVKATLAQLATAL